MSQVGANTNHCISHLQGSQSWPLKILLTGFRYKGRHPTHSTSPVNMGMGLCTLSQPTLAPPIKESSLKILPPSGRLPISMSLSFLLEFCVVPSSEIYLMVSNFLCLWSPFCRLQDYISSHFWCQPSGGWGWSRALCRLLGGRAGCLSTGG